MELFVFDQQNKFNPDFPSDDKDLGVLMKINSYASIHPLFGKISEAGADKQGGAGQNAFERHKKKDEEKEENFEASLEAVEAAVDGFADDKLNSSNGISASAEGAGPGLRVVLKDASGGVLRSVSGEEFLKLREAASSGARSGRLLDRKA
jgi:hypothetical protein